MHLTFVMATRTTISTKQTADKKPKRTAQHIQRTSTQTPTDTSNITCPTHRTLRSPLPLARRIRTPLRAHLARTRK